MENEFLSKVEDNAAIRSWSEKLQSEKGDSLAEGYISELQDFTRINVAQNELQELRDVWASWEEGTKQLFYQSYSDMSYLLDIRVDKCPRVQVRKTYARVFNGQAFAKKLMSTSGMSEPWALRHVDEVVINLFDRLEKGIMPVPAILAETFRSLSTRRKTGEGRQYKSRQFVPTAYGLSQCEFFFKGAHYKKKVRELSDA
ncbi:hypothetical protein CXB51_021358 [Gossypium anomalum]|uniref:Uncharacterized protein n=1 Tax=Gossypium anomalum TaxID=47600 RepID=A0A8J5YMV2_9ROSI|nr:hypothetical protein CXB51_021358 [Gossypium anomalum]